jgi:hypothetical protein
VEKGDTELTFEPGDGLGQRRLRDEQSLGSPAETTLIDHCQEVAQLTRIHPRLLRIACTHPSRSPFPSCTSEFVLCNMPLLRERSSLAR